MQSLLIVLSVAASIPLVSCTQGPVYPEPDPTPGKTARIDESSGEGGFMTLTYYGVSKVDGLPLRLKTRFAKGGPGCTLPAGKHELTLIMSHTSPMYKNGALKAEADVSVVLKPDGHYEAHGELQNGVQAKLWIQEKDSKKRVSNVAKAVPQRLTQPGVVFVPVPAG